MKLVRVGGFEPPSHPLPCLSTWRGNRTLGPRLFARSVCHSATRAITGGPRENRTPLTASLQGKPVTPLLKPIIKRLHRSSLIMVRVVGFEPTRPFGPQLLRLGRLPIPSHPHGTKGRTRTFNYRDFYQDDHWAAALPLSNNFSVLLTLTRPTIHIVLCAGSTAGVSTVPPPSHTLQVLRLRDSSLNQTVR